MTREEAERRLNAMLMRYFTAGALALSPESLERSGADFDDWVLRCILAQLILRGEQEDAAQSAPSGTNRPGRIRVQDCQLVPRPDGRYEIRLVFVVKIGRVTETNGFVIAQVIGDGRASLQLEAGADPAWLYRQMTRHGQVLPNGTIVSPDPASPRPRRAPRARPLGTGVSHSYP